ncbi:MAG: hypothetical protein WBA76_16775 [Phormidesmis sp.]
MRHPSTHTVDISAEPVSAFETSAPDRDLRSDTGSIARQSLGTDFLLIFISLAVGLLFTSTISAVVAPVNLERALFVPPQWLIMTACALPALFCLFMDALSTLSNPVALPFARSRLSTQAIYAHRIHLMLLAFYFTAILVALCWSALTMVLVSKIFISAVFAFALYALGRSIPSKRLSFVVSGILFLVVLIATQAFIVIRLESSANNAGQDVLNELVNPEKEKAEDPFKNGGDAP